MKKRLYMLAISAVIMMGTTAITACAPEEEPEEHIYNEYDDSTGLSIGDSIMVNFGDETWKSLTYTAEITQQQYSTYRWAEITAHRADDKNYPAFRLKIFLEPAANHTNFLAVNDPGQGYTVPGAMTGDSKGGALFYYENEEIHSPDGTRTSDWWPLQLTTSVLKYDNDEGKLTARVTAKMFYYKDWVDRTKTNVADCETRDIAITFGGLNLLNKQ